MTQHGYLDPNALQGVPPGQPVVRGPFDFAYNTPGIADGVEFYTPTVGDVLVDAWVEIVTAFNGTTPMCDVGPFTGAMGTNGWWGWYDDAGAPFILPLADGTDADLAGASVNSSLRQSQTGGNRVLPATFLTDDPIKVVVSQDGLKGGSAVGGSAGSARVYLFTASPVEFE